MGDTFNLSGDFRGSVVNMKSRLENVQQTVGALPADADEKQQLQDLVAQLSAQLQQVPAAHQEDAEAVAETTKALVDQASVEKPNRTMLQITGAGLKQAAQNLAEVAPTVIGIATQIVLAVGKITGAGG